MACSFALTALCHHVLAVRVCVLVELIRGYLENLGKESRSPLALACPRLHPNDFSLRTLSGTVGISTLCDQHWLAGNSNKFKNDAFAQVYHKHLNIVKVQWIGSYCHSNSVDNKPLVDGRPTIIVVIVIFLFLTSVGTEGDFLRPGKSTTHNKN